MVEITLDGHGNFVVDAGRGEPQAVVSKLVINGCTLQSSDNGVAQITIP